MESLQRQLEILRRGVAELDGRGEVVSGIVVMRQGQNALEVIESSTTRMLPVLAGAFSIAAVPTVPAVRTADFIKSGTLSTGTTLPVPRTVAPAMLRTRLNCLPKPFTRT